MVFAPQVWQSYSFDAGNRIEMVLISGQDITLEPLESRSIQLTAVPKKEARKCTDYRSVGLLVHIPVDYSSSKRMYMLQRKHMCRSEHLAGIVTHPECDLGHLRLSAGEEMQSQDRIRQCSENIVQRNTSTAGHLEAF